MKDKGLSWYPAPRYIMRKELLVKILNNCSSEGKSILEFGYGAGDMLVTCSKMGMDVYGYDHSDKARTFSEYWLRANDIDEYVLYTSKEEISNIKYDFVMSCEVLEHIEADMDQLTQWKKVINDNGKLIISVPAHINKWSFNDVWAGHFRRYEKVELQNKLQKAGYKVEYIWSYPVPFHWVLDKLLDKSARKMLITRKEMNMELSTKDSGVIRDVNAFYRFFSKKAFLWPMILLQELFLNTDIGSGYVVVASVEENS